MDFLLVLSRSIPRRGGGSQSQAWDLQLAFFCTSAGTLHSLSPHIVMRLSSPRLHRRGCSKQGSSVVGYSTCTYCCIWIGWWLGLGEKGKGGGVAHFSPQRAQAHATCLNRGVGVIITGFVFFGGVPKLGKKKSFARRKIELAGVSSANLSPVTWSLCLPILKRNPFLLV